MSEDEKIEVRVFMSGSSVFEYDAEEYWAAKANGTVDHLMDLDLSDMEVDTTVVELIPGGDEYDPYGSY